MGEPQSKINGPILFYIYNQPIIFFFYNLKATQKIPDLNLKSNNKHRNTEAQMSTESSS